MKAITFAGELNFLYNSPQKLILAVQLYDVEPLTVSSGTAY